MSAVSARKKKIILYLCFAVFCLLLSYCTQYTHDDWDWGISAGIKHLLHADVNSRYAGNLTVVLLTRSQLLKTIVLAAGMFFTPIFIVGTAMHGKVEIEWVVFAEAMLLIMRRLVWAQTFGWVSGFSNYCVSIFFMFAILNEMQDIPSTGGESPQKMLQLFLLAAVGQLFIENVTLYMLALAFIAWVFAVVRYKTLRTKYTAIFFGCAVGTAIMFSSSIYSSLFNEGQALNNERQMLFSANAGIGGMIQACITGFAKIFTEFSFTNLAYISFAAAIILFIRVFRADRKELIRGVIFAAVSGACAAYLFYIDRVTDGAFSYSAFTVSVLLYLIVTLEVYSVLRGDKPSAVKAVFTWVSAVLAVAPLSIVVISGGRLYFTPMCFQIITLIYLVQELVRTAPKSFNRLFAAGICVLLTVFAAGYTYMYAHNEIAAIEREKIISEAIANGEKELVLQLLPHGGVMWHQVPSDRWRMETYKAFYGIPDELELIFDSEYFYDTYYADD